MNPIRQLLRQPVRVCALLLILVMAGSFACLGYGALLSSRATAQDIESSFVTIAIPTNEQERVVKETIYITSSNKYVDIYEMEDRFTPEMRQFVEELSENSAVVAGVSRQQFASAYSSQLSPITTAHNFSDVPGVRETGRYMDTLNYPYMDAVFVITITDVTDNKEAISNGFYGKYIYADINQVAALHPDYPRPTQLQISSTIPASEFDSLGLEVGRKYLVYGYGYSDGELYVRDLYSAMRGIPADKLDWGNISYDLSDLPSGSASNVGAVYRDENGEILFTIRQHDLDLLDKGMMVVDMNTDIFSNTHLTFAKLDGTLEEFLKSENGEDWARIIEQTNIRNQSVPVIGTDRLEAIYRFHENDAFLVKGRSFREEDYAEGRKVCILSESMALNSGVDVGDKIELNFYPHLNAESELSQTHRQNDFTNMANSNYMALSYYSELGFYGEPEEYEVVGIYRETDVWSFSAFAFTPNTVFVPNASFDPVVETISPDGGMFYTLLLENGGIEEVRQLWAEQGFPDDILNYFDSGYTAEIQGTLKSFRESSLELFVASCVTWAAAFAAYIGLFVLHQRRTVGLMLSLGAGRKRAAWFLLGISLIPTILATVIGGIAASALLGNVMRSVFLSVSDSLETAFSAAALSGHRAYENTLTVLPETILYASAVILVVYLVVLAVVSWLIVRKKPLTMIKK